VKHRTREGLYISFSKLYKLCIAKGNVYNDNANRHQLSIEFYINDGEQ